MKSTLRPTSPADLNEVRQFLQRAFNAAPDAPFLDPAVMAWKYWDRRDDWDGPRGYVLERDGVIVAHAGIYPMTFAGEARGIQMIDWASTADAPGAGVALLQKLDGMFDFIYSIGGSDMTCRMLPAFGFVEYARQWRAARPIRPLRQILTHQHRNWKLAPRLARNLARSVSGRRSTKSWKLEEIAPAGISDGIYPQSPRSPAFVEYLLRCPALKTRLYGINDESGARGHLAIGVLRGQARVAGVWFRDPDQESWQAAFSLARQAAARLEGVCEIVAAGTVGVSEQGALLAGMRMATQKPIFLLNRKGKLSLPAEFQFQLCDDDVFFLDTGSSSYWT